MLSPVVSEPLQQCPSTRIEIQIASEKMRTKHIIANDAMLPAPFAVGLTSPNRRLGMASSVQALTMCAGRGRRVRSLPARQLVY